MKNIINGIIIWIMIFIPTATFDLVMFNMTNGDFDFNYTMFFGCLMAIFSFMFVYKVPVGKIKFKRRKDFVTTLDRAVRVKRVKK
ncbi:MAG: hypothetical protein EKK57_07630 [Proteobacteria bacterium]|nr:MAG: hypothetical protein EKK57_07630 [Pseudomonadota bacterium]